MNLTMPVLIVDDDIEESGETVVLTLLKGSGYVPTAPNTRTTLTIHNDNPDAPRDGETGGATLKELIQARIDKTNDTGDGHSDRIWRGGRGRPGLSRPRVAAGAQTDYGKGDATTVSGILLGTGQAGR